MRYLADTHSFLWFITGDTALSATARQLMDDKQNPVYVSYDINASRTNVLAAYIGVVIEF